MALNQKPIVASAYHGLERKMQETSQEKTTREDCGFKEIEGKMPSLRGVCRDRPTIIDNLTSYLGKKNPFSHPVTEDHTVWLFDNTAWQEDGQWKVEVVASYFVKHSGKDESKIIADLAELLGLAEDEQAKRTMAERLRPLFDTVLPAHTVEIQIGNSKETRVLGPGSRDGISNNLVPLQGAFHDGETMLSRALRPSHSIPLCTTFAAPTGWAVISDIDDTIKITMTSSPLGILRSTFVDPPTPVPGMPELYALLNRTLDNPPFWYLSASPYNLYPFLRRFREDHYPAGTLLLREASWMHLAGFLASLTQGTLAYKTARLAAIRRCWPRRKLLCVGDSTQSDPEAYGELCRRFPGWIRAVFIRRVVGVEPMDEEAKNGPERFEKAFEGVPRAVWTVFTEPAELLERVSALGTET